MPIHKIHIMMNSYWITNYLQVQNEYDGILPIENFMQIDNIFML